MKISMTLAKAIEDGNIGRIRSVFYTIVHEDPNFSTGKFRNTLEYVKRKNISNLFDRFDGTDFKDEWEWTEEYWADVASELVDNFCEERISHLEKVGKKVFLIKKKTEKISQKRVVQKKQPLQLFANHQKREIGKLIGIVGVVLVIVLILLFVLL